MQHNLVVLETPIAAAHQAIVISLSRTIHFYQTLLRKNQRA